ncbi:NANO1 protein, partial [Polyodon spathula]|nr:NANO1 protein [Polyodon spathula]
MDFLNHNYLNAGNSYDYTFNFWNDYLGLSTLVTKNSINKNSMPQNSGFGGTFAGFDLFGIERKVRKTAPRNKQEPKICVFCRNNGAPEEVYGSHVLKTPDGRVVCPILRAYTCPLCSANGDNAHTIKYCPLSKDQPPQRPLKGGRAVGGKRLKIF